SRYLPNREAPGRCPGALFVAAGQSSGLENGRFRAHISRMATIVQCNCGAEYRRTEEKFLVPQTADAVCAVCGAALESWLETTHLSTLDSRNKKGTLLPICSHIVGSRTMLRMFVEEAAALASITLFVAMIAVWALVIPQL